MEYNLMSNAELKIKMTTIENEYEHLKNKIASFVDKMEKLDNEYVKIREIYNKRTRGKLS